MTKPRIGSLCTGYGGLDMGVHAVIGGEFAWFFEYDSDPSKILEYHWPGVPNYGDLTAVDWATVAPVDVITAGYPCQPFSVAGDRKGSTDERHLWPYVLDAIRYLRPRLAILENVRGHLTLGFDDVLRDLAEAGYDAEWICLPASDAGAPHRRERIFIVAYPAGQPWRVDDGDDVSAWRPEVGRRSTAGRSAVPDAAHDGHEWSGAEDGGDASADSERERGERRRGADDLARAPRTGPSEGDQRERHGDAVGDRGAVAADTDSIGFESLWRIESQQRDADGRGGEDGPWGEYEPAIRRWESVTGRIAPAPTVHGRLAPEFVEWMMGLPEGHVSDVDLTRAKKLKALGNGVVPQQAALAVATLMKEQDMNLNIQGGDK